MNKIVIIGIILFAVILGFYFISNKSSPNKPINNPGMNDSKNKSDSMEKSKTADNQEMDNMKKGNNGDENRQMNNSVKSVIAENPNTSTAILSDVTGGSSAGTGYILRDNSMLSHYVEADLPDPVEGSVYEGWLVNNSNGRFVSTGVMKKTGAIYYLEFYSNELFNGYDGIVITLESKVDSNPEEHILEGEL